MSAGNELCPVCTGTAPPAPHLGERSRAYARRRGPLDGADAQALEHALTITERERDSARAELAAARTALGEAWCVGTSIAEAISAKPVSMPSYASFSSHAVFAGMDDEELVPASTVEEIVAEGRAFVAAGGALAAPVVVLDAVVLSADEGAGI